MLILLSFTFEHASFELLEQLSRHHADIASAIDDPALTQGSVVLSTCNRFEVYADTGRDPDDLFACIAHVITVERDTLRRAATIARGKATAEHLFAVAAGLESAVIGEEEIAGQVRRAHDEARQRGTLTHDLDHLFRSATRTSREVGHRTEIRSAGRSLVHLALRIAESRIADWTTARVLLVGTGAYAGATVTALRGSDVRSVEVFSPSGRAETFAARHGLAAVAPEGLSSALRSVDLVIACTRAHEPVLTAAAIAASRGAEASDLLLIDLGLPRNIEPAVDELAGVSLLDLETVTQHAPESQLSAEIEARELVQIAAEEFSETQAERDALPALLALRTHVAAILDDELFRARKAAGANHNPSCGAAQEAALRRFSGKLLHLPMTRIRSLGRAGRAEEAAAALETLFGIGEARSQDNTRPQCSS